MEGPEGENATTRAENDHFAYCGVLQDDGTEYPLPAGDPRFSATVESYIEAYAPVDGQGDCLSSKLADILGVTYDLQKHPEITAGAPNYH